MTVSSSKGKQKISPAEVSERIRDCAVLVALGLTVEDACLAVARRRGLRWGRAVHRNLRRHEQEWADQQQWARNLVKLGQQRGAVETRMVQGAIMRALGLTRVEAQRRLGLGRGVLKTNEKQHPDWWKWCISSAKKAVELAGVDGQQPKKPPAGTYSNIVRILEAMREGATEPEACRRLQLCDTMMNHYRKKYPGLVKDAYRELAIPPMPKHARGRREVTLRVWMRICRGALLVRIYGSMREASRRLGLYPGALLGYRRKYATLWNAADKAALETLRIPDGAKLRPARLVSERTGKAFRFPRPGFVPARPLGDNGDGKASALAKPRATKKAGRPRRREELRRWIKQEVAKNPAVGNPKIALTFNAEYMSEIEEGRISKATMAMVRRERSLLGLSRSSHEI